MPRLLSRPRSLALAAKLVTAPCLQHGAFFKRFLTLLYNSAVDDRVTAVFLVLVAALLARGELGILEPAAVFLNKLKTCRVGREVHSGQGRSW